MPSNPFRGTPCRAGFQSEIDIFASATSLLGSPDTATILRRDFAPAATVTVLLGTPSHAATVRSTARLASPFSAGARTRTTSAGPCAVSTTPSMPSRADLGLARTTSLIPEGSARQG
jgi:hypothetical protein